jgi:hypothetical protein
LGNPFLEMDKLVGEVANWRVVPCFGAIEMGWFVSEEIDMGR